MNKENVLAVADAIEAACAPDAKPTIGFNMSDWIGHNKDHTGHKCCTTGCIAGWAAVVDPTNDINFETHNLVSSATYFLGLSIDQEDALFYANLYGNCKEYADDIQPQRAVAVLRHLAATGEVDWTVGASAEAAS